MGLAIRPAPFLAFASCSNSNTDLHCHAEPQAGSTFPTRRASTACLLPILFDYVPMCSAVGTMCMCLPCKYLGTLHSSLGICRILSWNFT